MSQVYFVLSIVFVFVSVRKGPLTRHKSSRVHLKYVGNVTSRILPRPTRRGTRSAVDRRARSPSGGNTPPSAMMMARATARDSDSRRGGRRWPARTRERVHHCSRVPSPRPGASTAWHTRPDPLCLPLDRCARSPSATRRRQPWRALFLMLRCGACGPSSGMNRSRR